MGNLITTFSSVEAFANSCSNNYSAILARANETLSQVEKMLYAVQADSERLAQQIIRGRQMLDEIQLKVEKYQALMEDAAADVDRCNAEIDYILSHPITRTYTDEDGNEHTVEEIDEAALAAAERALDQAQALYEQYRDKYEEATAVMYNVSVTVTRFEQIKNGIDAVAQSIQSDIYEIKKYINAIINESEYNLQTLHAAIDGIATYIASRPIYMPVGTIFSDYSASGGLSPYSNSSIGTRGVVLDEGVATASISSSTSYESVVKAKELSERYFNKLSKRDAKGLSYAERRSIEIFCNESTIPPEYDIMNNYLRNGGMISNYLKDAINTMTNTISKHTLPRDMVLYRGMGNAEKILGGITGKSIDEINRSCVGKSFIERGFSSTSILENDAMKYVKHKGALLEIKAPCGAEGIFTGEISRYRDTEHEVTLQRGSIYKIDNVVDCGDFYKINLTLTERMNYE